MKFKEFLSLALSAVTVCGLSTAMMNPASAQEQQRSHDIAGVAISGGSVKGSSTFLSHSPSSERPAYLLNTLKTGKVGCGVNLPALNTGDLIFTGYFLGFDFQCDVPNQGTSPVSNFSLVVVTDDNVTHTASHLNSTFDGTTNGVNTYTLGATGEEFTPPIDTNAKNRFANSISIRYNGGSGPIYVFHPRMIGITSFGLITIFSNFTFETTPNNRFNN